MKLTVHHMMLLSVLSLISGCKGSYQGSFSLPEIEDPASVIPTASETPVVASTQPQPPDGLSVCDSEVQGRLRFSLASSGFEVCSDGVWSDASDLDLFAIAAAQGATGPQGPVGPPGVSGPQGPEGSAGLPGLEGSMGLVGAAGPQGAEGAQGPQGAVGGVGPSGPAGPSGDQGPQGATGAAGTTGPAGPAGPVSQTARVITTDTSLAVGDSVYADFSADRTIVFPPNPSPGDSVRIIAPRDFSTRSARALVDLNGLLTDGFDYSGTEATIVFNATTNDAVFYYRSTALGWISGNRSYIGGRRAGENPLSFSMDDGGRYTYYSSAYNLPKLTDGNQSVGAMWNAANPWVIVDFGSPRSLNRIDFYGGQFNGCYHQPSTVEIFSGSSPSSGTLLWSATGAICGLNSYSLSSVPGLNLPLQKYLIRFYSPSGSTSVNELSFFGN